jgi:hypothetical protein
MEGIESNSWANSAHHEEQKAENRRVRRTSIQRKSLRRTTSLLVLPRVRSSRLYAGDRSKTLPEANLVTCFGSPLASGCSEREDDPSQSTQIVGLGCLETSGFLRLLTSPRFFLPRSTSSPTASTIFASASLPANSSPTPTAANGPATNVVEDTKYELYYGSRPHLSKKE